MFSEVFSLNSHLNPLFNLGFEFPPKNRALLSSECEINQLPMPFVSSVHLNEIALASLHLTIHNDSSSTLNLSRSLYILTTAEGTISFSSQSLCSNSTFHLNPTLKCIDKFSFMMLFVVHDYMSDGFYQL